MFESVWLFSAISAENVAEKGDFDGKRRQASERIRNPLNERKVLEPIPSLGEAQGLDRSPSRGRE